MEIKAFTFAWEDTVRDLPCEVSVLEGNVTNPKHDKASFTVRAIWDTGASGSAITAEIAKTLKLEPISMVDVHTAAGIKPSNVYVVDLILPNDIIIQNVQVTEADMITQGLLIGMDVISLGDFAVTNLGGKTRFSFSIPSTRSIDFVQEAQRALQMQKHGSHSKSDIKTQRKKERKNRHQGHKK